MRWRHAPIKPSSTAFCLALLVASGGDPTSASSEPPGRPSASSPARTVQQIAPPPPGSGTGAAGLVWDAPESWIAETPSSAMRRAQYRIPGPEGDAELVIFYFGPGQGGDAMANARRWASQFTQPDGRPSSEVMSTERIRVGDIAVLLVEVNGTYSGGMMMRRGPAEPLAGHMLLGAIAEGGDANWFFKLTGPEATVSPQRQAFRSLIESLRRGG